MKQLETSQMELLIGGSYCSTLQSILQNNCIQGGALQGATYGYSSGGCNSVFDFGTAWLIGQTFHC